MNQMIAYFTMNLKILSKDKISIFWSVAMPSFFLLMNKNKVYESEDMRFWWIYIILVSYIHGVGLHALILRESGNLKTYFSIHNNPIYFFFANLFTQMIFSFVCMTIFNIVCFSMYQYNLVKLIIGSIKALIIMIPIAFLGFNLTYIRKVHVNSLSTIINVVIIIYFFHPLLYPTNTIN